MRYLLALALALPAFSQITQSIVFPANGFADNAFVTAQPGDCRKEIQIQNWANRNALPTNPVDNSTIIPANTCGLIVTYLAGFPGSIQLYWQNGNMGTGACVGSPSLINLGSLPSNFLAIRVQKTVVGNIGAALPAMTSTLEAWDSSGNYVPITGSGNKCTYASLGGSYSTGEAVGDSFGSTISTSVALYRESTTLVPLQSIMPVTAPLGGCAGLVFEWKFDNSTVDSCNSNSFPSTLHNTPCGGLSCYVSTGTVQNLVVSAPSQSNTPFVGSQFLPFWSSWITMSVGVANSLDGSHSFGQAASSSAVNYSWAQTQGASAPPSNAAIFNPTVTPPSASNCGNNSCPDYIYALTVTGANGGTATTNLEMGAVAINSLGVVQPADPKVTQIFGSMIAFGQNPWRQHDQVQQYMVGAQATYQITANDFSDLTPGTGTVAYPFSGKGVAPGTACTTLSAGITSTSTSMLVADATCLSVATAKLPTWILVGNVYTALEGIRILESIGVSATCGMGATNVTTGPAKLCVAYDGRGMSGNVYGTINFPDLVRAQAWNMGDTVGEFRVQGTSTLFGSDLVRPVCPAGLPGPPGPVAYSFGTVTMTASSTTITGTGSWTGANGVAVGGFIRIAATHASGTPFIFWAQIVTLTDATHLVVNRPAPADIDVSTPFSYKITSQNFYLSLEFPAPNGSLAYPANSHTARILNQSLGCESETSMFSQLVRDVSGGVDGISVSGLHYSSKAALKEISQSGTFDPNFYGTGLGARNFYYRSGYTPALTLANYVDEQWVIDAELADGFAGGQPLAQGGGVIGAMADLTLNSSTALIWPNVEKFALNGENGALNCNVMDTRTDGAEQSWLSMASVYDTNATNAASFTLAAKAMLTRDQNCKRNAVDGYSGSEVNSWSPAFAWIPNLSVPGGNMLTLNSTVNVTGSSFVNYTPGGGYPNYPGATPGICYGEDIITLTVNPGISTATVASGTLTQQSLLYFYDGSRVGVFEYTGAGGVGTTVQLAGIWQGAKGTFSAMSTGGGAATGNGATPSVGGYGSIWTDGNDNFTSNSALQKAWACKWMSSSSLTLFRPWDGPPGSAYQISYYNTGTFAQQPFFLGGYKATAIRFASNNSDATLKAGNLALLPLIGEWYNRYGYDSLNNLGSFYTSVFQACQDPTDLAAGVFNSIHGSAGCGQSGTQAFAAGNERVNSAEGGGGMLQYYLAECAIGPSQCAAAKPIVDKFYGAIFGADPSQCATSVVSTCDGTAIFQLQNASQAAFKWPGFFFGVGGSFTSVWPAIRLGAPVSVSVIGFRGNISFRGNIGVH